MIPYNVFIAIQNVYKKIEFQPWTNLDKKVIGVPLIYEANFENFSTYADNFQPQNFKNPLDHSCIYACKLLSHFKNIPKSKANSMISSRFCHKMLYLQVMCIVFPSLSRLMIFIDCSCQRQVLIEKWPFYFLGRAFVIPS